VAALIINVVTEAESARLPGGLRRRINPAPSVKNKTVVGSGRNM
jgi:hypothetical protein